MYLQLICGKVNMGLKEEGVAVVLLSFRNLWCHPEDDYEKIREDLFMFLSKLTTVTDHSYSLKKKKEQLLFEVAG